jgi:hypothetical protein
MKPPTYNAEELQQMSQEQGERNVAMAVCVQLAGRAIIRVVARCEEAQDNCNLGECESRTSSFVLARPCGAWDRRLQSASSPWRRFLICGTCARARLACCQGRGHDFLASSSLHTQPTADSRQILIRLGDN